MADRGLTGVLLVGGASRRFGSPKALARLDGETLAERAWNVLGEAFAERLAVGKASDELQLPFPLVDDNVETRAPLAGVVAGLRVAPTDVAVFLPVDCPLVAADSLHELGTACSGDAAVPPTGPLPGAYRKTALPVLERRLETGQLALRDALAELDVRSVRLPPDLLVNVNEPADLDRLPHDVLGVELEGTVEWFDNEKGFGRIAGDDGYRYFVHFSAIQADGHRTVAHGQRVVFAWDGGRSAHGRKAASAVRVQHDR